ncbi:MAG: hypothetical protein ABF289_18275 [Clostridiales bacterium]
MKNDNYSPDSGKKYKSDGTVVYTADIIDTIKSVLDETMGGEGGIYVTTATPRTPPSGKVIRVIEARTESSVTAVGNVSNITARTLEVNGKFYGKFTSVTVHTGTAILYYGVA